MNIKELLEAFKYVEEEENFDSMEDSTGTNEIIESSLLEKPAEMEKIKYNSMEIKEPEIDNAPIACKLLKQCEELEDAPKKYIVQDVDSTGVPESQDQFDNFQDALNCLKRRNAEEPDKYIEIVDTEEDIIVASTDEIEDGTLSESKLNEVSFQPADDANTKRRVDSLLDYANKKDAELKGKDTTDAKNKEKETNKKLKRNEKLFKKWKKEKGIKENKCLGELKNKNRK